jgi:hypothetical protein
MAGHRSIILSLSDKKVPSLITHVEDRWDVARDFHHAMREVREKEGDTILYCALINLEDGDTDCGCK